MDARYLNQPREVSIETFTLCNAACSFCPYPTLERKGVQMDLEKIVSLIDEMSEFELPFYFSPFKVNEPFLDTRLEFICQTFMDKCSLGTLRLFTNGTALTRRNVEWINELPRVEHLWISLNSMDPKEYFELMRLPFEVTARRIDDLHRYVISNRQWTHKIVLSRVVSDDANRNRHFIVESRARWPLFESILIKRDSWLGHVEPSMTQVFSVPCSRWEELSILSTGVAALCCMDGTGTYAIGSVNEQRLLEIYNQPAFRERRLGAFSRKLYEPCRRCTY